MKIILDKEEQKILKETAEHYAIEPERLQEAYEQMLADDIEEDLWDIATYHWKELGGRNFEQEAYEQDGAWDRIRNGE